MDFKNFDKRMYKTVGPQEGYSQWAETYEDSVPDQLDIRILERIQSVNWRSADFCLDMACGTGRIGQWLKARGTENIDGIDITQEMLDIARPKSLYRQLHIGSVEDTGLKTSNYDLIVMSLVDEHLSDLKRVYREACRLGEENSQFVVIGMHPFFFMAGMPTHFDDSDGNPIAIDTHIHLFSEHFNAARAAGFELEEIHEGVVDDEWIKIKPKWEKMRDHPVNYGLVWRKT